MIIQCNHCNAKFRMDDSKLAKGAVKVRCAKCKEVFVVEPPAQPVEPAVAPTVAPPEPAPASPPVSAPAAEEFSFDSGATAGTPQDDGGFSFDEEPAGSSAAAGEPAANEFDWQDKSPAPADDTGFDLSSFDSSLNAPAAAASAAVADSAAGDFDFGEVDFSAAAPASPAEPPATDSSLGFGEVSFEEKPAAPAAATDLSVDLGFPPDTADFSFAQEVKPAAPATAPVWAVEADAPTAAVPGPGSTATRPASFADLSFDSAPPSEEEEEELPPTAQTSRKKGGSLFPVFVICGAIILLVVTAGAGLYFFGGPSAFSRVGLGFVVDWYGGKKADEGGIALKNVTASYVANATAGELFVVRGEAINNFKGPRASVQVKVTILGPGGTPLVSKSAFCGNMLTNDQLAALPQVKIDEAMNNQFGDSLVNMGLKPGATIGFVVALSGVPKEAVDYSVQVSGSTVAAK